MLPHSDGDRTGGQSPPFAPIGRSHPPLSIAIASEIKQAILSGRYRSGDRLVEESLAEWLGVSRNPVREALRHLEAEGFVQIAPRRGASVATIGLKEAHELFEVRAALEALSARLAATRATDDDLASLEQIVLQGEKAADAGQLRGLPDLNTEFHARMVAIAGNGQLARLIAELRDRIQWVYSHHIETRAVDSWKEHRQLFAAVAGRTPEAAAHIALRHIAAAEEAFAEGKSAIR